MWCGDAALMMQLGRVVKSVSAETRDSKVRLPP
jgi:hypothetical protein